MNKSRRYTVGLVQMSCTESPADNLEKAVSRIEEAAQSGAQLVCLQELFRSTYFCQREETKHFDLAEPIPGPTTERLATVAQKTGVVILAPLFERRAAGVYHNSAAVIDADGRMLGLYRKMHIPDDPGYFEKYYFAPGDLGFPTFETRVGRIAVLICWDQWYPEGARLAALGGADIIFYPTAIGWAPTQQEAEGQAPLDAWRTVQRGHAIANGTYVAAVNRVGREGKLDFWGTSFLSDPQGVLLAEASSDREEILLGEVDLDHLEEIRRQWPFLRDRRIDAYAGLDRRFLDK